MFTTRSDEIISFYPSFYTSIVNDYFIRYEFVIAEEKNAFQNFFYVTPTKSYLHFVFYSRNDLPTFLYFDLWGNKFHCYCVEGYS